MPITLSGMASGLDTESIITQLMAIEQNKVTAVQRRQISVTQHKTDLTTIKTKLDAVKTAAADLSAASTWKPAQTSTSSDPTKVDVTMLGGAGIGGHSIQVDKLASSAQHGFAYSPSTDAGALDLFYGTDPNARRQQQGLDRDPRERHRDRRRDADQRQRGRARLRRRRQGRRDRAPRLLRPQDRRELRLHGRLLRASAPAAPR